MFAELSNIKTGADYRRDFKAVFWSEIAEAVCQHHRLPPVNLERSSHGENVIFLSENFVVKIYAPFFRNEFARERAALEFVGGRFPIRTPEILHTGDIEGWNYLVLTRIRGRASREIWFGLERRDKIEIISRLGAGLAELHSHNAPLEQAALNRDWQTYIEQKAENAVQRQRACGANPIWLKRLPSYIAERIDLLPKNFRPVMLHGDVHALNLLLMQENGRWQIGGLIDFGDSFCGFSEYEFVAPGVLMIQGDGELQREFLTACGYSADEINADLRARLMLLTIFYECADLRKYALRLAPEAVNLTLDELEKAIWRF